MVEDHELNFVYYLLSVDMNNLVNNLKLFNYN